MGAKCATEAKRCAEGAAKAFPAAARLVSGATNPNRAVLDVHTPRGSGRQETRDALGKHAGVAAFRESNNLQFGGHVMYRRVGAHEYDGCPAMLSSIATHELRTVHDGHVPIHDDRMRSEASSQGQRLLPAAGRLDLTGRP